MANLGFGLPMPVVPVKMPDLRRRSPDMRLDPSWLDLDDFFPPGARRVGPTARLELNPAPENRMAFPSAEPWPSPDKRTLLFHDGMRRNNSIYHWLMLQKSGAPSPNAIFLTKLAFDVSWSEDSARFAVTHFLGDNSSEVFTVETADLARKPVDLRPFIEEHFPPHLAASAMFVKAYRWTQDGRLIVRGIGRARSEGFELFGCEVVTAFTGPDREPRSTFVRGFIKPQDEP